MRPKRLTAPSTALWACVASVTSSGMSSRLSGLTSANAARNFSMFRPVATTRSPPARADFAIPRPMPLLEPVTNQTLLIAFSSLPSFQPRSKHSGIDNLTGSTIVPNHCLFVRFDMILWLSLRKPPLSLEEGGLLINANTCEK